jgi:hypothetical protein
VADGGYGAGNDIQAAQENGHAVLVVPKEGNPSEGNPYASQYFRYDPVLKTLTCPEGKQLDPEGQKKRNGVLVQRYRCHCQECPVRQKCTRDPQGRQVEVWSHTAAVGRMRELLNCPENKKLHQRRGQIVERQFGHLKQHNGFRKWTVWGLKKVKAQWL